MHRSAPQAKRREAFLKLVRDLVGRGVPLHGVGLQGHINGKNEIDRDGVYDFVTAIHALGLSVHVTELDVIDDDLPGPIAQRDAIVASRARDFLDAIATAATPSVIATWGITDRYTWVPIWYKRRDGLPNRPLPFDAALPAEAAVERDRLLLQQVAVFTRTSSAHAGR